MWFHFTVGVGGKYDATNAIQNPIVCGVTTLDIDHTSKLGDTIEEIALHKAGIMKAGRLTIVDGFQRQDALKVLKSEAMRIGSSILTIPPLNEYDWGPYSGLFDGHQNNKMDEVNEHNAALALQLSRYYYNYHLSKTLPCSFRG